MVVWYWEKWDKNQINNNKINIGWVNEWINDIERGSKGKEKKKYTFAKKKNSSKR